MKKNDLIGRVKRTIYCKLRKYYFRKWQKVKPGDFFDNPERVTSLWYASREGRLPDLKHPNDFNERLMAINLAAYKNEEQRQKRIIGADKFAVRKYVEDKGFGELLNEIYGVYDKFDDIDFGKLPNKFVIKLTNGSGCNYICKDKSTLDIDMLRSKFVKWMAEVNEYGLTTAEWHYNLIKPRIIIEKYLSTLGENISLVDYKFHCINNKVYGEYVCYDRVLGAHKVNYDHYDADWNLTDGVIAAFHPNQRLIAKPQNFERMKQIAESLSEGVEYVRVDLYEVEGKILFGELTYTPMGNFLPYTHERLEDMERFYEISK